MVRLPQQDEFRNFCLDDETEKVYRKLEEAISIYWESKGNKKDSINLKLLNYWANTTDTYLLTFFLGLPFGFNLKKSLKLP